LEIHCSYDPETKSGTGKTQRKVKGTIHYVSAKHSIKAEARIYDRLFLNENPDIAEDGKDFKSNINPDSLKIIECFVEPEFKNAKPLEHFQFERQGYFCVDKDSSDNKLIFNRTVLLRDSWAKKNK